MNLCIKPEEVRAILPEDNTLTDPQINAAVQDAVCMVERAAACMEGQGISSTCQARVAVNLAAHYAAVTDFTLNIKTEKDPCCGGSATYGFELGEGIKGTPFGQKANGLSGGCLAELDKQPARLFSIGCH